MKTGFFFLKRPEHVHCGVLGTVLESGNCKLGGEEGVKKHVDIVSDCVIDLVSSVSLKHYMHDHFQDLVDDKNYHRTGIHVHISIYIKSSH